MKKVLFVCEANIGRSQMAEAYYNHFTGKKLAISAAVKDYLQKYNHQPTEDIIEIMKEDGVDISRHRMKLLTENILDTAEKIVVLCDKHLCPEFLLKRKGVIFITIDNPFGRSERTTKAVRDQIKEIVLGLLKKD